MSIRTAILRRRRWGGIAARWILASGFWRDESKWNDTAVWKD
jgi:hypothetical protein